MEKTTGYEHDKRRQNLGTLKTIDLQTGWEQREQGKIKPTHHIRTVR